MGCLITEEIILSLQPTVFPLRPPPQPLESKNCDVKGTPCGHFVIILEKAVES
jgi:hypothetical protein